jgi:hypothetical protein
MQPFAISVCCHRYQHAIAINIHESSEYGAPRERNELAVTKYPDAFNTTGAGVGVGVRGNFGVGAGVDVCVGLAVGCGAVTVAVGVGVGLGVAVVESTLSRSLSVGS